MAVIKCVCMVTVFSPFTRLWLWTSWAWGCCRPAARWQTSWQRASPVRDDGHILLFHFSLCLCVCLCNFVQIHGCFSPSSCGGHQQATRASSQPGGHLPDYTHRKGKRAPSLSLSFIGDMQRCVCVFSRENRETAARQITHTHFHGLMVSIVSLFLSLFQIQINLAIPR